MKKRKRILILLTVVFCLLGGALCLSSCGETALKPTGSSESYKGKNYEAVAAELRQAGFTDIETRALDDLTSASETADGAVDSVIIDDMPVFTESQEFPQDARVVVTYHIIPKIPVPVSSDDLSSLTPEEVVALFAEAGFVDPTLEKVRDLEPDSPADLVVEVRIGDRAVFSKGEEMPFDASVHVICHYPG